MEGSGSKVKEDFCGRMGLSGRRRRGKLGGGKN